MSESPDAQTRRRWIALGEVIAIAALIVSALGLWLAWKNSSNNQPTRVVEQRQAIPLTLRGTVANDGREIVIAPVEQSHALESLTLTMSGAPAIEIGSDGTLNASDVESALKDKDGGDKGSHSASVKITARYVEMGKDRTSSGNYVLRYRWEGGGLLGGHSLRFAGLSR
jgi:hypothetical protein